MGGKGGGGGEEGGVGGGDVAVTERVTAATDRPEKWHGCMSGMGAWVHGARGLRTAWEAHQGVLQVHGRPQVTALGLGYTLYLLERDVAPPLELAVTLGGGLALLSLAIALAAQRRRLDGSVDTASWRADDA